MTKIIMTREEILEYEADLLKARISDLEKINEVEYGWAFFGRFALFIFIIVLICTILQQ